MCRETGLIDFNEVEDLAMKHRPKMITVGASAYSRNIDYAAFRQIADKSGAFLFADIAHPAGLIARRLLNDPIPHCHVVTSTTHKTLRGPRGGLILMGKDFDNPFGLVAPKSVRTKRMSELIDSMVIPGIQGGPLMHVIAGKAVPFLRSAPARVRSRTAGRRSATHRRSPPGSPCTATTSSRAGPTIT